jgi:hypothetical protein
MGRIAKVTRWLPYIAVGIDVGIGVHDNIRNETPQYIVPDAIADAAVTGVSIWGSVKVGTIAGTAVGGPVGTVVGAGVGLIVGVGSYFLTDVWQPGGQSIRSRVRNFFRGS